MRQIILLIIVFGFINSIYGQEIEIKGIYSSSTFKKYLINPGYGIGYNQYFKSKNRLSITLSRSCFKTPYDDIYSSNADGISTYIKQVEPNNQRIDCKLYYVFKLIDHPKSRLNFGPEIGLNYFIIKENYDRIANENISAGHFTSDFNENNKIGLGFILEFELKEIFNQRISTFFSVNPEITNFEIFGTTGGYNPYFIGWMNYNFGLRYLLKQK